jgi:hypothetical protein
MNDNGEALTKGMFRDAMDDLAALINEGFQGMELRMAKQEDLLALTKRIEKIERYLDNHGREFKTIHKNSDVVFTELGEIRKQLNRVDARADVLDLQIRVSKLERKAKI